MCGRKEIRATASEQLKAPWKYDPKQGCGIINGVSESTCELAEIREMLGGQLFWSWNSNCERERSGVARYWLS